MADVKEIKSKLWLIFHGRYPSEKAASLFAAKSCEAFADTGYDVTLLAPRRIGRSRESAAAYYGIRENFRTVFIPVFDLFLIPFLKRLAFFMSYWTFSKWSFWYLFFRASREDVIYSNEMLPLLFASFYFKNTVYEVHDFPKNSFLNRLLFKRVGRVIATNKWKSEKLREQFGLAPSTVLYEPNAVDLARFEASADKAQLRLALSIPLDKKIFTYVGMLRTMGMEKGIDVALEALRSLPSEYLFLVVGGSKDDVDFYTKKALSLGLSSERVFFVGFVKHSAVPSYMKASDILIAPFPKNDHYNYYMSPMKLFEYMASGVPVVATDLVTIREIVGDGERAVLVPPDDAVGLAQAVERIGENPLVGAALSQKAKEYIGEHDWLARAERIRNFMERR